MVNDFQQRIYNDYLKAIGEANNRPYKPRKDFEKIDDETKIYLHRLELFFNQFKHISPYNFFVASLKFRDLKYLSLGDYIKHSAVVAYSKWNTVKYDSFIDSETSIKDFIDGFKFIVGFCLTNNLPTKEYRTCVNNVGIPWILIHLNEQKISYYHLHALDISRTSINSDYTNITFNEFDKMFSKTKSQYINSKELKNIGNKLRNKIETN